MVSPTRPIRQYLTGSPAVAERPILFQGAMVRAILAGTKTQTRRIVKGERVSRGMESGWLLKPYGILNDRQFATAACPYGQPGDRLWVRESHWWFKDERDPVTGYYPPKMTVEDVQFRADGDDGRKVWRPSIHMPRWACRLVLEITAVRVERLRGISAADCWAEGIPSSPDVDPAHEYCDLWEQINGPGSWQANPWVWVVEFKKVAT